MSEQSNPTSLNPTETPTNPEPDQKPSFWQSRTAVVLFLFLFFPIGLYLLWKSPNFSRPAQIAISIVVALLFLGSMGGESPQDASSPAPAPRAAQRSESSSGVRPGITMANFKRLQNGMTYEQVVEILGEEGEEMSRVGDMGMGIGETVMYSWTASSWTGANMNATFQGNRLTAKAQFGLK